MNYQKLDPLLEPFIAAVRRVERFLGPDDDWVEEDRRIAFEALQRHLGGLHHFTREKDHDDYICTTQVDPDRIEVVLMPPYQRNLASTRKYRTYHGGGKQWAVGSFVYDPPETDWQHHVYLFPAPDGGTDIYGHRETSAREGAEHVTDANQIHGDPNHRVRHKLDEYDIEYDEREVGE